MEIQRIDEHLPSMIDEYGFGVNYSTLPMKRRISRQHSEA